MISKENLHMDGKNPHFYESFTDEDAALTKMILNQKGIEYTEVFNEKLPKSNRFYVKRLRDIDDAKTDLFKEIKRGNHLSQFEHEKSQYENLK